MTSPLRAIIPIRAFPSLYRRLPIGGFVSIAFWLLAALALLAFLYWLIVVGEATYLGRYAVRFIYQRGARFYDAARRGVIAGDERDLLPLLRSALARARAKIAAAGTPARVVLREGDAGSLPWPDGAFDLVTSLEALEFFPRPRRALAEMARVLEPGGTLVVSKYPDRWARALPLEGLTRQGITRLLQRLGFGEIEIRTWQPGHYELV